MRSAPERNASRWKRRRAGCWRRSAWRPWTGSWSGPGKPSCVSADSLHCQEPVGDGSRVGEIRHDSVGPRRGELADAELARRDAQRAAAVGPGTGDIVRRVADDRDLARLHRLARDLLVLGDADRRQVRAVRRIMGRFITPDLNLELAR